jgi:3-oxoacyl-[acyl-carrier-protein] synthase-3
MLGGHTRHLAVDLATGRLRDGVTNASMATAAAQAALADAACTPADIDLIVLATSTPDYPFPATALFVQERLGISDCAVTELRAGCGGMAQAFAIATSLIARGAARRALLIGSELISPFRMLLDQSETWNKGHLVSLSMFGDGAGAAVLGPARNGEVGIIDCMFRSMSTGRAPGMLLRVGGALAPTRTGAALGDDPRPAPFHHDFRAILTESPKLIEAAGRWVAERVGLGHEDVAWYVPPQTSGRLIDHVAGKMGAPRQKVFSNFSRVGNTSSASIYLALDELNRAGTLRSGDVVVLLPAEATKWTYGAVALRWERS